MVSAEIVVLIVFFVLIVAGVLIWFFVFRKRDGGGGSGALNSACTQDSDCGANLTCDTTTATCKITTGSTCTASADCQTGDSCQSGTCTAISAGGLGGACMAGGGCSTDTLNGQSLHLVCSGANGQPPNTCLLPVGAPSTNASQCISGVLANGDICAPVPAGGTCTLNVQCASGNCSQTTNTCVGGGVPSGGTCSVTADCVITSPPLECVSGKCTEQSGQLEDSCTIPPATSTEGCYVPAVCVVPTGASGTATFCTNPTSNNSCSTTEDCVVGYTCDGGFCRIPSGQPCAIETPACAGTSTCTSTMTSFFVRNPETQQWNTAGKDVANRYSRIELIGQAALALDNTTENPGIYGMQITSNGVQPSSNPVIPGTPSIGNPPTSYRIVDFAVSTSFVAVLVTPASAPTPPTQTLLAVYPFNVGGFNVSGAGTLVVTPGRSTPGGIFEGSSNTPLLVNSFDIVDIGNMTQALIVTDASGNLYLGTLSSSGGATVSRIITGTPSDQISPMYTLPRFYTLSTFNGATVDPSSTFTVVQNYGITPFDTSDRRTTLFVSRPLTSGGGGGFISGSEILTSSDLPSGVTVASIPYYVTAPDPQNTNNPRRIAVYATVVPTTAIPAVYQVKQFTNPLPGWIDPTSTYVFAGSFYLASAAKCA